MLNDYDKLKNIFEDMKIPFESEENEAEKWILVEQTYFVFALDGKFKFVEDY